MEDTFFWSLFEWFKTGHAIGQPYESLFVITEKGTNEFAARLLEKLDM